MDGFNVAACMSVHLSDFHDTLLAGQIGYALAPQVARGAMLGPDQPVILHLLDIPPAAQSLEGVKMELIDAALPLLVGKQTTAAPSQDTRYALHPVNNTTAHCLSWSLSCHRICTVLWNS